MEKLNFEQMELIFAGSDNRTCMIAGAAALGAGLFQAWGPCFAIIAGAAFYGCFD